MTLQQPQLVAALTGGALASASAGEEESANLPPRLATVLSLVLEALYHAGREPATAILALEALGPLLHGAVTGEAFLPKVTTAARFAWQRGGGCGGGLGRLA